VSDFVDRLSKQSNQSATDFEKQFFEKIRPTSLLKRFASTEEIANLVVYVSSPAASATNGAALRVDGGVVRAIA
jgi:NAD(P)-dependent dehydrogenase (short-subunit alcohol dehydrogenase family)